MKQLLTDEQLVDPAGTPSGPGLKNTIVFDTSSGISLEEQEDILAGIDSLTGENRLVPEPAVKVARKKGFLFPLFVNLGAVLLLVLGFALLSFFHVNDENEIRESSTNLGYTERLLIQEIRQETELRIREKERQISDILFMLSAADAEYKELQASVENLTEAQQQRAAALLILLDEYHNSLAILQEDRASILEDSRLREVVLRTQTEERVRELSSRIEQGQTSLSEAMEELRSFGSEQDRANRAESQMGGFYAAVNSQISNGLLTEASATLEAMKEFLAAPSLQGIRSLEARKQTHMAAIALMEMAIASSKSGTIQSEALEELRERNAAMEQMFAEQEETITSITSRSAEQDRVISEFRTRVSGFESQVSELKTLNENQKQTLDRRDGEIGNLRTETARRDSEIQTLRTEASRRDGEIQTLRTEVTRRDQQVSELNGNISALQTQNTDLQRQNSDLQRRMEAAIRAFTED